MNTVDRRAIFQYHNKRIHGFGKQSPRALGWSSEKSQTIRFQVLMEIAQLHHCSVLDVGCGHGDLLPLLHEAFRDIDYTGIDQMAGFLNVAATRYQHIPFSRFIHGEFSQSTLKQVDYVFASGVLAYKFQTPAFAAKMIEKMFRLCGKGIAFNMLRRVDNINGALASYDPRKVTDFCKQFTPNIRVLDDYLENDFTVFMYR